MPEIRALFWDVGGVLLTNAWDHEERNFAIEQFHLDKDELESRHKFCVQPFEEGRMSLDEYLQQTVFSQPRTFSPEEFKQYMFSLSKLKPDVLEIARCLRDRYLMATINNESRELNLYRIEKFGLRRIFQLFVSSCFVGLRKPESGIYRLALEITQRPADECCFVDDRALNLEIAAKLGMQTIEMQNVEQLKKDFEKLGVGR